jgi:hypothetical protein
MTDWSCARCGSTDRVTDGQCASCGAAQPEREAAGGPEYRMPTPVPVQGAPTTSWTAPRTGPAFHEAPGHVLPGFDGLMGGGQAPREVAPDPMPPTGEIQRSYDLFSGIMPAVAPVEQQPPPAFVPQPEVYTPQQETHVPPQPVAAPARTGGWPTPAKILIVVLAVALVGLVAFPLIKNLRSDDTAGPGPTGPTTAAPTGGTTPTTRPSPTPSPSPTGPPGRVGLVSITPGITHPATVAVATVFDTFFAAVNNRQYDRALAQYDPAGVVNRNDPKQVQAFKDAVSTTLDGEVVLHSVDGASSPAGAVVARVTFQSQQSPGYGPKGREQETCTAWDATYTLTQSAPGTYLILRSTAASSTC